MIIKQDYGQFCDMETRKLISPVEISINASKDYAVGDLFSLNGKLYKATQAISMGGGITIGTNAELVNSVSEELISRINTVDGRVTTVDGRVTTVNNQFSNYQKKITRSNTTQVNKASNSAWFYTGSSISAATGHLRLVQGLTTWATTRCAGLGISSSSTTFNIHSKIEDSTLCVYATDIVIVLPGETYYLWAKRINTTASTEPYWFKYIDITL